MTGAYSAHARSGVLILSGANVSTPTWQDALRAVTYWSSSEDPTGTQSAGDRIVTFMVSDGDASSAVVSRVVTVTPANDAPGLGGVRSKLTDPALQESACSLGGVAGLVDVPGQLRHLPAQHLSVYISLPASPTARRERSTPQSTPGCLTMSQISLIRSIMS